MNQDNGAAAGLSRQVTPNQFEVFYVAEYPKLVKLLVVLGATLEEAEDAVQKAMADFAKRSKSAQSPIRSPAAYVRRAAVRFFVKERKRDRERLPREIRGGHLISSACLDDELTAWEDEQFVEHVLGFLTPTQRDVIKLVMDGASTREIAEELGKSDDNVRQHLKNGRDRLKVRPEVASHAPRDLQARIPAQKGMRSAATSVARKEEIR